MRRLMQGHHLTGDLFDCACPLSLLRDSVALRQACVRLATSAGLTVVGEHFHTFAEAGGVTGLVLLAESHLAVHTWPELNAVTLDVYVCNFHQDNSAEARQLMDALIAHFAPARTQQTTLHRGTDTATKGSPLTLEWISASVAHGFTTRQAPTVIQSPHQRIEWHDTHALGRVFALDGAFMASEEDEFIYHECMVHVPALALARPQRALVMGGGDGCSARELLKHASIVDIVVAELDAAVVASARVEFATVNADSFDDPRVSHVIGDALAYLRDNRQRFDLIVMDLTDPEDNNAAGLYSPATYRLIRENLSADGVVSVHLGSAFFHPDRFARTLRELRAVFTEVHAFKAFMPLYGAEWGMACASMATDPQQLSSADVALRLAKRGISDLRFYTPRVHASLFAWPAYAELLGA